MASYIEKMWKPVSLKKNKISFSGSGSAASSVNGSGWYDNIIQTGREREEKIEKYRMMDKTIDIFRALDIIAEDISSENADDNDIFEINFDDSDKVSNGTIKTVMETLGTWEKKTELDYRFFDFARELIKYGIVLFEEQKDGSLVKLKQDRIVGYVLDEKDEDFVSHYLYDRNKDYFTESGDLVQKKLNTTNREKIEPISVDDLLILKIGEGPYGKSILEDIYKTWRQLQLLEDAVVIYRIVRAPERRVFYVDVGRNPIHKAEAHLERVKRKMRQRQVSRAGELETEFDPASMQEDYFIAQSSDGKGSRVETLPGGDNLGRIEDLMLFSKKLALGLRIPPSYLDTYSDDINGASYNDGRLGTAYIAELRYAGFVKRIQKKISKSLFTNFRKYSKKLEVNLPENIKFFIAPPQSFGVYKENELFNALLNTYASADGIEALSKRESMKRFLGFDEDELIKNEKGKIMEMGYSEKEYNKMKPEIVYNLIYGDQSLAHTRQAEEELNSEETSDEMDQENVGNNEIVPAPEPAQNI